MLIFCVKVLLILWQHGDKIMHKYDLVEIFSGQGQVSEAFRSVGRTAGQFDSNRSADQNILTRAGFATLV